MLHALLHVTAHKFDDIESKQQTALLLMDLRKAFDIVFYNILLQKLYHYARVLAEKIPWGS